MRSRSRWIAFGLALLAGVAVYVVSTQVFPFHSTNHDEAVYLQQAAMLLEGRLFLHTPVPDSFRPWFFVDAGDALYPKYAPVPAAMFAVGEVLGDASVSLGAIGATIVGLTYGIVAEAFDRRTGLLAAAFLATSPLFLINTAVFLPYAPTAAWNLLFAFAYLRAHRTGSRRCAGIAGGAIGIAFFSRPYTAILFAVPFVLHAAWVTRRLEREALVRNGATAALGLVGVLTALGYNAVVTGSPLLFPYQAFAPLDGLGFGRRAILGYERIYTPSLALRANAAVLQSFFTDWFAAGVLGTGLAAVGLGASLSRSHRRFQARQAAIAGLFLSIGLGNVYFWGNLNVVGSLATPNDGLVRFLGPYYHYDMLLPTAAFAARGSLELGGWWRSFVDSRFPDHPRVSTTGVVVAGVVVLASIAGVVASPVQTNLDTTEQLEAAYEPFEEQDLDGALVFLPTPYGDWLNHPFQALRNDPSFDGEVVYAIRENQFDVVDAFPDRSVYRYTYRGFWAPFSGSPVSARLQPVRTVSGERIELRSSVGIPDGVESVSISLSSDEGRAYYVANDTTEDLDLDVVVDGETASIVGSVTPLDERSVPVHARDDVVVELFVEYGAGDGFTYRIELPVEPGDETVRAMTPYLEVCTVPLQCGGEAAYVPEASRHGVFVETHVEAVGEGNGESEVTISG